jgi:hypothetical protein
MNAAWSPAQKISRIIAEVFAIELEPSLIHAKIPEFNLPTQGDPIQQIKDVIKNGILLDNDTITNVVAQQLNTYKFPPEKKFNLPSCSKLTTLQERWQAYLDKLENIVQQVKQRVADKYEINHLMPPQHQILELQQECLDLTSEYYGAGNGNICCFYFYYIRMCDAAHITRYVYFDMDKYVAADQFISLQNFEQRTRALEEYEQQIYQAFIKQGGLWAYGRSEIDATSIANIFYFSQAQQLIYLYCIKKLIVELLSTTNYNIRISHYGELPQSIKEQVWSLIQKYFVVDPTAEAQNIYYKYAKFCNNTPGACFTDVPEQLQNLCNPTTLHAAIKMAGILSNNLVLISRKITEDWTPKRYLVMSWRRRYALLKLRDANSLEHLRIWPNEMPYSPGHGLSLCGDGLIEGLQDYGSVAYEWNVPIDVREEIDNSARDIEKMFREMPLLCPPLDRKLLPGEYYLYLFQNTIAYSTQPTQHLHIARGTLADFPIYNLPATTTINLQNLNATLEIVQVGTNPDSIFLRMYFKAVSDETIIKFLLDLHNDMLQHFSGPTPVDTYIQLNTSQNKYVFILEPHALLQEMPDRKFLNPETGSKSLRKPQYIIPEGHKIDVIPPEHRWYAEVQPSGREFLTRHFDATCKRGVRDFLDEYFNLQS